ncbi:MAG TPA: hypothetical protein PKY13_09250, partial [Microthrixaceae bacterium]|nr:hypothetical protein [Microthrixaceae bacterium]
MGFNNPDVPWKEIERALSDRRPAGGNGRHAGDHRTKARDEEHPGDGGDAPAWSRKRLPYEAGVARSRGGVQFGVRHTTTGPGDACPMRPASP